MVGDLPRLLLLKVAFGCFRLFVIVVAVVGVSFWFWLWLLLAMVVVDRGACFWSLVVC